MTPGKAVLVYYAEPLYSEAERRFNQRLTTRLEETGFSVFLPHRDGVEKYKDVAKGATSRHVRPRQIQDLKRTCPSS
jgi:nucleoside 2-deoxyribosyltransferase